ncbi:MAG: hypothetical protein ACLP01_19080 [Solirubrobacteraceae bacterium]
MGDLTTVKRAPRELMNLYWGSGVSGDVPALAWSLLSSLVPLALGVTALAAVVLGDYAHAQQLAARMADVLEAQAAQSRGLAAGYYLRLVAGRTPVELFLMLAGVLFTCYLASTGLLLGVGVTTRVELGRPLGSTAETPAQ